MSHSQVLSKENVMRSGWLNEKARSHMKNISTLHHRYQQLSAQSTEAVTANKISCKQARQELFQEIGTLYASFGENVPYDFYDDLCFQRAQKFRGGIFSTYPDSQKKLEPLVDAYQRCFNRCIIAINAQSNQAHGLLNELSMVHQKLNQQYGVELCAHKLDKGRGLKLTGREIREGVSACFAILECCNYHMFQQNAEIIRKKDHKAQELLLSFYITYLVNWGKGAPDFLKPDEINRLCNIYMKFKCYDRRICEKSLAGVQIKCSHEVQKFIEDIKNLSSVVRQEDKTGRINRLMEEVLFPIFDNTIKNVSSAYQVFEKYREAYLKCGSIGHDLPSYDFIANALAIAMFSEQPHEWAETLNQLSPSTIKPFEQFREEAREFSHQEVILFIKYTIGCVTQTQNFYRQSEQKQFIAYRKLFPRPQLFDSNTLFYNQVYQLKALILRANTSSDHIDACICCNRNEEPQKASLKNTWNSFLNFFQT